MKRDITRLFFLVDYFLKALEEEKNGSKTEKSQENQQEHPD